MGKGTKKLEWMTEGMWDWLEMRIVEATLAVQGTVWSLARYLASNAKREGSQTLLDCINQQPTAPTGISIYLPWILWIKPRQIKNHHPSLEPFFWCLLPNHPIDSQYQILVREVVTLSPRSGGRLPPNTFSIATHTRADSNIITTATTPTNTSSPAHPVTLPEKI